MKKRYAVLASMLLLSGGGFLLNEKVKPKEKEIKLILKDGTNTNPIQYENKEFFATLETQFPQVYALLDVSSKQKGYIIPGLKQTKSLYDRGKKAEQIGTAKDMVPQGITLIKDRYFVISAYSKSKTFKSVLWLLDRKSGEFVKTVVLDDIDHVGSLTYDEEHERLWVTTTSEDKGAKVESVSLEALESYNLAKTKGFILFEEAQKLSGVARASYMSYYKDQLFVGYFDKDEKGNLASFALDKKGKLMGDQNAQGELLPSRTWKTDEKIQGITFYDNRILLSQSYGRTDSKLLVFENKLEDDSFQFDEGKTVLTLGMPPYSQQLIAQENAIFVLFESGSKAYRKKVGDLQMDRVLQLHFKELSGLAQ